MCVYEGTDGREVSEEIDRKAKNLLSASHFVNNKMLFGVDPSCEADRAAKAAGARGFQGPGVQQGIFWGRQKFACL